MSEAAVPAIHRLSQDGGTLALDRKLRIYLFLNIKDCATDWIGTRQGSEVCVMALRTRSVVRRDRDRYLSAGRFVEREQTQIPRHAAPVGYRAAGTKTGHRRSAELGSTRVDRDFKRKRVTLQIPWRSSSAEVRARRLPRGPSRCVRRGRNQAELASPTRFANSRRLTAWSGARSRTRRGERGRPKHSGSCSAQPCVPRRPPPWLHIDTERDLRVDRQQSRAWACVGPKREPVKCCRITLPVLGPLIVLSPCVTRSSLRSTGCQPANRRFTSARLARDSIGLFRR